MSIHLDLVISYGKKIGVNEEGLKHIKRWGECWDDGIETHLTEDQWIFKFIVQRFVTNKYYCDLEKLKWEDLDDMMFTQEAIDKMHHMGNCEKCREIITLDHPKQLVYRSLERYIHSEKFPCIEKVRSKYRKLSTG